MVVRVVRRAWKGFGVVVVRRGFEDAVLAKEDWVSGLVLVGHEIRLM